MAKSRYGGSTMEICFCCFLEVSPEDEQPGEATWTVGETTVVSHVVVCIACRRLGCEVLNPDGCKRPEKATHGT
jgi:hypothetical protein